MVKYVLKSNFNQQLEFSFDILNSLFNIAFLPCILCDRGEDGDKLICFIRQLVDAALIDQVGCCKQPQPVVGFTCFLAGDRQLTDEVGLALPGLPLLHVGTYRRTGAQQLVCQCSTDARRFVQSSTQHHHPLCKSECSRRQIAAYRSVFPIRHSKFTFHHSAWLRP